MSPEDEARMLHAEHMLSRAVTAEASLLVRDARVAELEALFQQTHGVHWSWVAKEAEQRHRIAELEAALRQVVHAHDGTHAEDCRAFSFGSDADLPEEPSDADHVCTCGATNERERARRIAKGLGLWPSPSVPMPAVSKSEGEKTP